MNSGSGHLFPVISSRGRFSGLMAKHESGGPNNGNRGRLARLHLFPIKARPWGKRGFERLSLERLCHCSTLRLDARDIDTGIEMWNPWGCCSGEHHSPAFTFGNGNLPGGLLELHQMCRCGASLCGETNEILR
jgi:hypothetical protein